MRQLVTITPARLANRTMPHRKGIYGPTWWEMARFLATKYRLDREDMLAIMRDVFRYIDAEVMRNGERFNVPGFGTFVRVDGGESRWGTERDWMKVDRVSPKTSGTLYTQQDDEEDAGPREE